MTSKSWSLAASPQAQVFRLDQPEDRNLAAAEATYERLTQSKDPAVRAGALVRLARVRRKQHDWAGAKNAYETLQTIDTDVDGEPARLKAHQGKAKVFEEAGDAEALRREAGGLAQLLFAGGVPIDRATFESYCVLLKEWGMPDPPPEAVARTEAARSRET